MGAFRFRSVLAVLALGALLPLAAVGQTVTGSIAGTVLDSTGAAIPGAAVTITNEGTGAVNKTTTGATGGFLVRALPVGTYKVEVATQGFRTGIVTGIELHVGTSYSVPPFKLEVGDITETVVVEGGTEGVQTTTSAITGTVDKQKMTDLPILNRNPINLVALQAGVNQNGRTNTVINGMRASSANMTVDGINIQDNFIKTSATFSPNRPMLSQVQEFTISTSNTGAETGTGSSQINMVTPSGASDYHGEGFWYYRTAGLEANEWFGRGATKPKLVQHQFGGNAGGPIIKEKLFGYGWYEGFELSSQRLDTETTLTDTARGGIFTYTTQAVIDTDVTPLPATSTCAVGGLIPIGTLCTVDVLAIGGANLGLAGPVPIDPHIAGLLAQLPTSSQINDRSRGDSTATQLFNTGGFKFAQDSGTSRKNTGLKLDYNVDDKSTVQFTYQFNDSENPRGDIDNTFNPNPTSGVVSGAKLLSASYRATPSANMTHEIRGGFNLTGVQFSNSTTYPDGFIVGGGGAHAGTGLVFQNPINSFQPQGRDTDVYSLQYNGSYARGEHNFSYGYQLQGTRVMPFTCFRCLPTVNIGIPSASTADLSLAQIPGLTSTNIQGTANGLLASLGGLVSGALQEVNVTGASPDAFVAGASNTRHYELNNHSLYFVDSWRMMPKLTFNYGARFEFMGQLCEADGLHLNLVRPVGANTQEDAVAAQLDVNATYDFAGKCGSGPQFYEKDLDNFAPQVGLAYDMFGDGKMSIRAAYSIHYFNDEAVKAPVNIMLATSAGLSGTIGITDTLTGDGTLSGTGIPIFTIPAVVVPRTATDNKNDFGGGTRPQRVRTISPELQTPYAQEWSLSIQRDIGWNTIVEVGYRGNRAVGLTRTRDLNQVNIRAGDPTGFLAEFIKARNNAFLNESFVLSLGLPTPLAPDDFDIFCRGDSTTLGARGANYSAVAGCQPLSNWFELFATGSTTGLAFADSGSVQSNVRQNRVGELAWFYQDNGRLGTAPNMALNRNADTAEILINGAFSTWHAGVVEVRRRFTDGLYFQGNYTFSKALTNSNGTDQNNFDPLFDNARPELEKARAIFDMTHGFKANFTYELPFGEGHGISSENSIISGLLSGWQIGSIVNWQSGAPFSILSSRGTFNRNSWSSGKNTPFTFGSLSDVAALVGMRFTPTGVFIIDAAGIAGDGTSVGPLDDALADCTAATAFGPALLCSPEAGQIGNLGLRMFDNPNLFNMDFNIFKRTNLTEDVSMEIRAEAFNVTNGVTFVTGDRTITSRSFGQLGPGNVLSQPRVIQLGMRLVF